MSLQTCCSLVAGPCQIYCLIICCVVLCCEVVTSLAASVNNAQVCMFGDHVLKVTRVNAGMAVSQSLMKMKKQVSVMLSETKYMTKASRGGSGASCTKLWILQMLLFRYIQCVNVCCLINTCVSSPGCKWLLVLPQQICSTHSPFSRSQCFYKARCRHTCCKGMLLAAEMP